MELLTGELLSLQLQQSLPSNVTTIQDVLWALVSRFGYLACIIEDWVKDLEEMASTRRGGTCYRIEGLTAALNLIERAKALPPEAPEEELYAALAKPQILARIQVTLQQKDIEGVHQEMVKCGLSPSRGICNILD